MTAEERVSELAEGTSRDGWHELGAIARRLTSGGPARLNGHAGPVRFAPRDDPERAVWELRSALIAASGRDVDEDELLADEAALEADPGRWALASIEWSRSGAWVEVTVRLQEGRETCEGTDAGPAGEAEAAAARATAAALAQALGRLYRVELADLADAEVAGRPVRLAALRLAGPTGTGLCIGVAPAAGGRNRLEAAARAVLDAANRRFRLGWTSPDAKVLREFYAR